MYLIRLACLAWIIFSINVCLRLTRWFKNFLINILYELKDLSERILDFLKPENIKRIVIKLIDYFVAFVLVSVLVPILLVPFISIPFFYFYLQFDKECKREFILKIQNLKREIKNHKWKKK